MFYQWAFRSLERAQFFAMDLLHIQCDTVRRNTGSHRSRFSFDTETGRSPAFYSDSSFSVAEIFIRVADCVIALGSFLRGCGSRLRSVHNLVIRAI
jgi:hypothetical protein